MAGYEIPLKAENQVISVQLNQVAYQMTVLYRDIDQGGWTLDIADAAGEPIVSGIPLITGADLLEQYAYLGIGGALYVATDGNASDVPTAANLGTFSHLYWIPN